MEKPKKTRSILKERRESGIRFLDIQDTHHKPFKLNNSDSDNSWDKDDFD